MEKEKINYLLNEFKGNLNCIEISKLETIDFDIYTFIGSEKKSKQFDIVIKNKISEIIFVCNFYNGNLNELQNNIPEKLIVEHDFPYDYFVVSINEFQFLDIKNLNRMYNDSIMSLEEFLEFIKLSQPSLKQQIDFVREELKSKEFELQKLSKTTEIEINNFKKELELQKNIIYSNFNEIDVFKQKLNEIDNKIEEDLKFRLQIKLKEVDFLISLDKLDIPLKVYSYVDNRFGVGKENKVREIFSIDNSYYEQSFSILNNKIYLKIEVYNYYSKGYMELPEHVLSETKYYLLNEMNNTFNQVEINSRKFIGWVFLKELNCD
jgi:hypothetical protein